VDGNATGPVSWEAEKEDVPWKEAARLIGVPPDALVRWSQQLEFPANVGEDLTPRFRREELEALRATLATAHSVEGAIREARRQLEG